MTTKIKDVISYLENLEKNIPLLEENPELILTIFNVDNIEETVILNLLNLEFTDYPNGNISDLIKNNLKKIKEFDKFNVLVNGNDIKLTPKIIEDSKRNEYSLLNTYISFNILNNTYIDYTQDYLIELKNILDKKLEKEVNINLNNYEFNYLSDDYVVFAKHIVPYFEEFLMSKKTIKDKYLLSKNISKYIYYGQFFDVKLCFLYCFFGKFQKDFYDNLVEEIKEYEQSLNERNKDLLNKQEFIKKNYNEIQNDFKNIINYLKKMGYVEDFN